ncbi:hypothetical protein [Flavisericum labens]|uniref:hypothetical protein n=1 Tax=Flavisericum labens TaxID=3377112 RepID=UPI00387B693A
MKKQLFVIAFLTTITIYSQELGKDKDSTLVNQRESILLAKKKDSLKFELYKKKSDSIKKEKAKQGVKDKKNFGKFKLYPTNNMYNFIKLDTSSGEITIVQWSLDSKKRFEYGYINTAYLDLLDREGIDFSWNDYERPIGRFVLQPTTNNWTFILLDTFKGTTYQVQWGFEANERWAKKIE